MLPIFEPKNGSGNGRTFGWFLLLWRLDRWFLLHEQYLFYCFSIFCTVKFMTAYCYSKTAHSSTVINLTNNWDRKDKLSHLLLRVLQDIPQIRKRINFCKCVWHWNSILSIILQTGMKDKLGLSCTKLSLIDWKKCS